ncbi:diaminopimelate decarboxylase [Mycolicibacterium sp. BK556]|uniref:diaminopimelate decarboxylase n=1 Tax=Mycobacteriaceae TaxID=1762 RepID=UPI00105E5DB1|nr:MULTISPECIES: diaminopimelate decarboxylase [Mycobacteriaceae]MBB3604491.1 diaminopimelate decarboxylase [Mycolicibacterium sp. BK556]MBB3634796.1 diaminopimelate decarboxylase [Mycolicibacterium sp. BK607]MBB3752367.1 diaminopimelate decarboxylase [Mycolicibacterium sp. BK634]TDO17388.1 diaminopimelate decarboxylase [Mycobacterium sp. BK086]
MTLSELLPSLGHPGLDRRVWPSSTHIDDLGQACIGGVPLTEVADKFRTPTYVLDEGDFRGRIRRYRAALPGVSIAYAGKALLTAAVARWIEQEGLGLDVCSGGELATALAAGVDPDRIILHGNAKTPDELRDATAAGVGRVVVDSPLEIAFLAGQVRRRQSVLLRVIPGVDIGGHPAVTTGVDDQKFGFTIGGDQALDAAARILRQPCLSLAGLHCHIGSQVADPELYGRAITRMVALMADIRARFGVTLPELNIGGGHAVPYVASDQELDLARFRDVVEQSIESSCVAAGFPRPALTIEPGRAISARAGVTLYRVVAVKSQPGGRTFVAVDGGVSDNPRVALYGAKYTVTLANRHTAEPSTTVTVVGRHCEAGDVIARDVELPADIHPGDLLAVACTGAYHHSMASNYNMVGRPPLVAVADGRCRQLIRRETVADLLSRDCNVPSFSRG